MNEVAVPRLADTGTFFVEVPVCTNCDQPIERSASRPARTEPRPWIHSHNKSMYCYGRGDR